MTTFTTEDRELVELHIKTFPPQQCLLTHPIVEASRNNSGRNDVILQYRIEDSSDDLEN